MPFLNESGIVASVLNSGTQGVTGSLFLTLLIILMIMIVIGMMLTIPLEFISIIILPLCLGCATYYSDFIAPLGVILIYLSMLLTKNWIFR